MTGTFTSHEDSTIRVPDRRRFLQVAGTAIGGALLVACRGEGTATNPNAGLTPVPTSQALPPSALEATMTASKGKTYFPSGNPDVPDAYVGAWPSYQSIFFKPGRGGKVKVFGLEAGTPALPREENRYWQELESRLNVRWETNLVSPDVYAQKVATLLAGRDLPDLFFVDLARAPSLLTAMRQGAFVDLTPYLSGDAIKEYPNLARFSQSAWTNVAINGKIYGIPRPRPLTGHTLFYRKDWADKLGLAQPKNSADFLKWMKSFTENSPAGRGNSWGWGFAGAEPTLSAYGSQFFLNIFGVPNVWKETGGKLTYFIETEEYRQAVDYMRQIYTAGYVYPDSIVQTAKQIDGNFPSGKYGATVNGFTALPNYRKNSKAVDPQADIQIMVPFSANGGQPNHWMSAGYYGFTAIPSAVGKDKERVRELLRIFNYLAAPKFSEESNFLSVGINDWDNELKDGLRVRTARGDQEIASLTYIANGPTVFATPDNLAVEQQEYTKALIGMSIRNPVISLVSTTEGTSGKTLVEMLNDRITRIVKGTDPLSSLDEVVKNWQERGGNQIRQEYEEALKK